MYKVFIVDDEVVVRKGIRDNINWGETEFVFSGEASDGEMALAQIQEIKPDIVVTDIKMPFMDGLQLSKIIRQNMTWSKIIILSGYDEFDFAKEAISIGVTEYLLKPLRSSDLLESLSKVATLIKSEQKERENIEKIKMQLENSVPLLKENFLNELILGRIPNNEIFKKCSDLNISIYSKYYIVEIIEVEMKDTIKVKKKFSENLKVESIVSSIVDSNKNIIRFKRNVEQIALIFKGDSQKYVEEISYGFAQSIKYEVERNTECVLTIGIGSVREKIQGIMHSLADAENALKYKFVIGKNKIIDIKAGPENKSELIMFSKINVADFFKYGDKSNIKDFLDEYIKSVNAFTTNSLMYVYYAFMDMIQVAVKFIGELEGNYKELLPEVVEIENILVKIDSIEHFKSYSEKILLTVFEFRDSKIKNKYGNVINMSKKYIEANFSNQDISLNLVATNVNISPSHFSTIFSQETGETFIEYLTAVRMKKAMELLKTTNQKSCEIAYNVGYNDPHYFCYLFKKFTKLTPIKFRNND